MKLDPRNSRPFDSVHPKCRAPQSLCRCYAILIRPAPVPGLHGPRSFALPEFDPFWKRVVETGVLVIMHASDSGYSRYANDWEGSGEFRPFQPSPFRSYYSLARNPAESAASLANGELG